MTPTNQPARHWEPHCAPILAPLPLPHFLRHFRSSNRNTTKTINLFFFSLYSASVVEFTLQGNYPFTLVYNNTETTPTLTQATDWHEWSTSRLLFLFLFCLVDGWRNQQLFGPDCLSIILNCVWHNKQWRRPVWAKALISGYSFYNCLLKMPEKYRTDWWPG